MIFLSPWFLIGTVLITVPIIIHLWFKKRLRKIQFSSLAFLRTSEAKRFGWLRIREILTLITRCLFVACLVLSLARPRLQRSIFTTSRTGSVVLVIDNSYSMHYHNNFQQAQTRALEVIDRYSTQSQFMIIPLCQTIKDTTQSRFWTNKRSAIAMIESLDLTFKTGTVFQALSMHSWNDARYSVDRVYIGDGQAHIFVDYPDTLPVLHWIQIPADHNTGITHAAVVNPIALPEETYDMIIMLENYGTTSWQGNISLYEPAYTQEIPCSIAARSEQSIHVKVPSTLIHGTIHLESDSISPDNEYYFSFSIPREIQVLIVGTNPFIQKALKTAEIIRTPFKVTNTLQLGTIDIRRYDIIIMCGNTAVSPADQAILEHIVREQISSILVLLGTSLDPRLAAFLEPYCTIGSYINPSGYVTIDWIDYEDPVFSIFRDDPSLKTSKIYNYWLLNTTSGVLAQLTDEHPLVISKGNVTIIGTDLIPSSTDLIYKTAFIPLLYRLVMRSVQPEYDLHQYVGSINMLTKPLKAPTGELVPPDGEFLNPGLYTTEDTIIAVNVSADEGDIKPLGKAAARLLNITPIKTDDITGKDLSLFFLICALAFLLFEVILLLIR